MCEKRNLKNNFWIYFTFVCILSIVYVLPCVYNNIIGGDDILYHLTRFKDLCNQFNLGNFHPLVYPEMLNEYGYASGIFYPDYLFYPFALLSLLEIDVGLCFKMFVIFVNIMTGISFFLCSRIIAKHEGLQNYNLIGFIVFIISLLDVYKLRNYYCRMAVGEFSAMIFAPIIVLGMYYIVKYNKKNYILALGMTGLLSTHLLSFVMACLVLIVFVLYNVKTFYKNPSKTLSIVFAALECAGLSSLVWVPILEMWIKCDLLIFHGADFFVTPIWENTYLNIGGNEIIGFIILMFIIIYSILQKKPGDRLLQILSFSLLFLSDIFPWTLFKWFTPLTSVQFPWRFLSVFYFVAAYYLYKHIKEIKTKPDKTFFKFIKNILILSMCVSFFVIAAIGSNMGLLNIQYLTVNNETLKNINHIGFMEYVPYDMAVNNEKICKENYDENQSLFSILYDAGTQYNVQELNKDKNVTTNKEIIGSGYQITYCTEDNEIILDIINYPGYSVKVNGNILNSDNISSADYGFMKLSNIENNGSITITYEGTQWFRFGYILSLFSIAIVILNIVLDKNKNRNIILR